MRMVVSNSFLTMQLAFQKSKPRIAKLATLLNRDFNIKFDEYMTEIYGPVTFASEVEHAKLTEVYKQIAALAGEAV